MGLVYRLTEIGSCRVTFASLAKSEGAGWPISQTLIGGKYEMAPRSYLSR